MRIYLFFCFFSLFLCSGICDAASYEIQRGVAVMKEGESPFERAPLSGYRSEFLTINHEMDLFLELPLTEEDKKNIHYIFSTMANKNVFQLMTKKGELDKRGAKIKHVHPLRMMGYLLSDAYLKGCMKEIRRSTFKWDGFIKGSKMNPGFANHMKTEYQHHNIDRYVPGFCELVRENPQEIMKYIQAQDWEGLAKYLVR